MEYLCASVCIDASAVIGWLQLLVEDVIIIIIIIIIIRVMPCEEGEGGKSAGKGEGELLV